MASLLVKRFILCMSVIFVQDEVFWALGLQNENMQMYANTRLLRSIFSFKRILSTLSMETADLCDAYGDLLQYVEPIFRDFGHKSKFDGKISTVKCHEDNSCVKAAVAEPGDGRVLVVDGGGSMRRALLGDNVAATACRNNWSGVIIFGCVRDTQQLQSIHLGIKALGAIPRKTEKKNVGSWDIPVTFAGVTFRPNEYVYADRDGIVVSEQKLTLEGKL